MTKSDQTFVVNNDGRAVSLFRSGRSTMDNTKIQFIAGVISSLIFIVSNSFMVIKATRTRDLKSYSLGNLAFANLGNLIYWIYILSLPFGPIWFLHAFYTVVTGLMLFWFFRYRFAKHTIIQSKLVESNQMCKCMMDEVFPANSLISMPSFIWPTEKSNNDLWKSQATSPVFSTKKIFPVKEVIT